ncbi:lysophospholipid acyltransferase family protein [Agriterribacter sp.]|uniref:lysophospholipid acyltransferase family protein n=1 Tax=Agriterribacter sp. TaxID=2821509 RepID=UPI002BA5D6D2|nr:lysophospholipid acyltransferase family protein [Agriterribacter sp.]HRP57765.1 lysophospholipid acyltransferase family protein [Agriterribacter sp.]
MGSFFERLRYVKLVRKVVYIVIGCLSYPGLAIMNRLKITGTEHLKNLPRNNVLFVSNHQTYFMDVIAFLHIFCAVKWRKKNKLGVPYYLLNPFTNVYFVSAEDTMRRTFMSRLMALAGSLTVKRTWVEDDKTVRKGLNPSDTKKILKALNRSWVITFPQGTTTAFAPGRKGTAFLVKQSHCVVVPIVIDGFNKAFHKKSLKLMQKNVLLTVHFKPPLPIDYNDDLDHMLSQLMNAIEQSDAYKNKAV